MKLKFAGLTLLLAPGAFLALSLPAQAEVLANYVCDDNQVFDVTYNPDENTAELVIGGETLVLPSIVTASGAAYSDGHHHPLHRGPRCFH